MSNFALLDLILPNLARVLFDYISIVNPLDGEL